MVDVEVLSAHRSAAVEAAGMKRELNESIGLYVDRFALASFPLLCDPSGQELEWLLEYEIARLPTTPLPPKQGDFSFVAARLEQQQPGSSAHMAPRFRFGPPVPDTRDCRYIPASHEGLQDRLEFCMSEGLTLIVTDIGAFLPKPLLDVLDRKIVPKGRNLYINISDQNMDYNCNFRLYLLTSLSAPQLPKHEVEKVKLLNACKIVGQVSIDSPPDASGVATVVFVKMSGCELVRLQMDVSALSTKSLLETFAEQIGQQPHSCELIIPNGAILDSATKLIGQNGFFPEL